MLQYAHILSTKLVITIDINNKNTSFTTSIVSGDIWIRMLRTESIRKRFLCLEQVHFHFGVCLSALGIIMAQESSA
jgi:hypothetical protein